MSDTLPIASIVVGDRHRKDLGDLSELAQSIKDVGLLQPIGVDPDGNLLFGERRLAACRLAGLADVPVHVVSDFDSAVQRLVAERDENTCRKDMTPEELVRLGLELEALERPRAAERQGGSGRYGSASREAEPAAEDRTNWTGTIVSGAIGMSRPTYERARAVVLAADNPEAPELVRSAAQEALAKMNKTGKVQGAYNDLRRAEKGAEPEEPKPDAPKDRARNPRLHHKRAAKMLPRLLSEINGIAAAIKGVDFSGCRLTAHEITQLDAGLRAIMAARKTLKECSQ